MVYNPIGKHTHEHTHTYTHTTNKAKNRQTFKCCLFAKESFCLLKKKKKIKMSVQDFDEFQLKRN